MTTMHISTCAILTVIVIVVHGLHDDNADHNARTSSSTIVNVEREAKALHKFVPKPPELRTVDQSVPLIRHASRTDMEHQLASALASDSHTADINDSMVSPSPHPSFSSSRQENPSVPSLLLLRHFRQQTPVAQIVPKPTVISSQETAADDAHPRLPARFVDTSALIRKSSLEKVHNNSSANPPHDLFQNLSSKAHSFPDSAKAGDTLPQPVTTSVSSANGNDKFFRVGMGENGVSTEPTFIPQYGQSTVNPNKRYSSVYNGFSSTQNPHTNLQASTNQNINVGTAGLSGLVVPDSHNRQLLRLLEILRKRNQENSFRDSMMPSESSNAVLTSTYSPVGTRSQQPYIVKKASTTARPRHETGKHDYPSAANFQDLDSLRIIKPPFREFQPNPRPTNPQPVSAPPLTRHPPGISTAHSLSQWSNTLRVPSNQRIYDGVIPINGGSLMSLLPHFHQQPLEVNRLGLADTSEQDKETATIKTLANASTNRSTAEILGLRNKSIPPKANENVPDKNVSNSATLGSDHGSLLHLVTAAPVEKESNLIIDMFEQVFSEDEMQRNPLVKQIHTRLEEKLEGIHVNAIGNPAFGFLLYFIVPFVIIAVITFTLLGVAPEYVGLTGLLIPLVIMATLTNAGNRSGKKVKGRSAGNTSSGENNNYSNGKDLLMDDAHLNLLKHLGAFERSYLMS